MPRKSLIRTNERPYHITIRSNNRDWFQLPMKCLWDIYLEALSKSYALFPVNIKAFVLMNNHYYLTLYTINSDLDTFMQRFNFLISKRIRGNTQRINRVFGDRYKWCLINKESYYFEALRYVFKNPVRAKLTQKCEDY